MKIKKDSSRGQIDALAEQQVALSRQTVPFVYNADIGLRKHRAKMAQIRDGGNVIENVSVIGDSITEGYNVNRSTTDFITKGYIGRVKTALAIKYGDVGRGFIPVYYPYGTSYIVLGGTWVQSSQYGVESICSRTSTTGSTATWNFNGTGIGIMCVHGSDRGNVIYNIDGGAQTGTLTCNGAADTAYIHNIDGLSDGNHTLVLTKTSDGLNFFLIGFVPHKGVTGVRINLFARYGTKVAVATPDFALRASLYAWNPSLTIISYTSNDYTFQTPLTTYAASLQVIVTEALKYGDVLLTSIGVTLTAQAIPQSAYTNILKQMAFDNNCAYLDLYNRWGGATTASAAGYYDSTNNVHLSDYGDQDIATAVLRVIDEY